MDSRNRSFVCLLAAALLALAPLHARGADDSKAKKPPDLLPIIARAAGDNAPASEKALDALAQMGAAGLDRLRAMEADTASYTDAQRRSVTIAYNLLTDMSPPQKRDAYRDAGKAAFATGDYALMARKYARIAILASAEVDDCLWYGHARQLAGKWHEAASAYRLALERVDDMLANPPERMDGGAPGGRRKGWTGSERRNLLTKRAALALLIGRILQHQCNDPSGAAAVYSSGYAGIEAVI